MHNNDLDIQVALDRNCDPLILLTKSNLTFELGTEDAARVALVLLVYSISSRCTSWLAKWLTKRGIDQDDIQTALLIFNAYINHPGNQLNPNQERSLEEALDLLCDQGFRDELGHMCAVGISTVLSSHFELDNQIVGDALDDLHRHLYGIVSIWPPKKQQFSNLVTTCVVKDSRIVLSIRNISKGPEIIARKVLQLKINHEPDDARGCNIYPRTDNIYWFILPQQRIQPGQEISCSWATSHPDPVVDVLGLSFGEEGKA